MSQKCLIQEKLSIGHCHEFLSVISQTLHVKLDLQNEILLDIKVKESTVIGKILAHPSNKIVYAQDDHSVVWEEVDLFDE